MWNLAINLPLMIGNAVPQENDMWECFLLLLDILQLCTARSSTTAHLGILEALILACQFYSIVHGTFQNKTVSIIIIPIKLVMYFLHRAICCMQVALAKLVLCITVTKFVCSPVDPGIMLVQHIMC